MSLSSQSSTISPIITSNMESHINEDNYLQELSSREYKKQTLINKKSFQLLYKTIKSFISIDFYKYINDLLTTTNDDFEKWKSLLNHTKKYLNPSINNHIQINPSLSSYNIEQINRLLHNFINMNYTENGIKYILTEKDLQDMRTTNDVWIDDFEDESIKMIHTKMTIKSLWIHLFVNKIKFKKIIEIDIYYLLSLLYMKQINKLLKDASNKIITFLLSKKINPDIIPTIIHKLSNMEPYKFNDIITHLSLGK